MSPAVQTFAVGAGDRVELTNPHRPGAVQALLVQTAGGGAGRAERLERARRRAAVAGQLVAIVALLAHVEDPVAADVDSSGPVMTKRGVCTPPIAGLVLHPEEVGAAGASR